MSRTGIEDKPPWKAVPKAVRNGATLALGSAVVRATRIWGGYGPTPTFRLVLADGRRAFFKGTFAGTNDFARSALLFEERVYRELEGVIGPWAPQFYGQFDYADWRVVLLEDLGPKSVPPWTPSKARAVARALFEFHQATVGKPLPPWIPRPADYLPQESWDRVVAETEGLQRIAALAGPDAERAHRWLCDVSPLLDRLIVQAAELPGPCALLHGDVRSDNLRLHGERLRLFDWPAITIGSPAWDVVPFAQTVTVESGFPPEQVLAAYQEDLRLSDELLDSAIAWWTSFFAHRACKPEIPGLPRVRRFQRQQLAAMLVWAARRFSLPEPVWAHRLADCSPSAPMAE